MGQLSDCDIATVCQPLISKYTRDLTPQFEDEIRHLNAIFSAALPSDCSPLALLNAIHKMQLQSIFGEVCRAFLERCALP